MHQRIDEPLRNQEQIAAQTWDIPVPPVMQEIVEVVPVAPQERDQNCAEQVMNCLVEKIDEGASAFASGAHP